MKLPHFLTEEESHLILKLEYNKIFACTVLQVAVCWLPSDGGEQCDQSGLAAPHTAGVSA